jgi:protein-disulfide isomerase
VWGVIGYAFLLVCLLGAGSTAAGKIRLWSIVFWISLAFSCYSVILALISTYIIGSYCIMCILSYGVNLAILFYAWIIVRRFSGSGIIKNTGEDIRYLLRNKTNSLAIGTVFFVSLVLIWFYFPTYWNFQPPQLSNRIPRGVTASGDPWLGASRPVLQIIEFADYQCFQCKKMHFLLRQLVADNPDTIRIVHRNYPMDHQFNPIVKEPFHRGSGKMALLAIYAASKGKFWQMNDHLYQLAGSKENIRVEAVAEALDLDYPELVRALNSRRLRYQLQKDIFSGNKLGISGTPAYVVDGKVYLGQIPAELLKTGMQN